MLSYAALLNQLLENLEDAIASDVNLTRLYLRLDFYRELSFEKVVPFEDIHDDLFIYHRNGTSVVEVQDYETGDIEVIQAIGLNISKVDERVKPDLIRYLNSEDCLMYRK